MAADPFEANAAADDLLRRCPPPPFTARQVEVIAGIIRAHYVEQADRAITSEQAA